MGALLRKREAPATISTPATAADIVATVHYVVAVCLRNYIFSWCFIALLVWLAAVWDLTAQLAAKHLRGPEAGTAQSL